jgi:hypothetical protein
MIILMTLGRHLPSHIPDALDDFGCNTADGLVYLDECAACALDATETLVLP